jgi:hypothetical protein
MTSASCAQIRPLLGALVDDELSGAEMLRAAGHLELCSDCTREFDELQNVGNFLRASTADVDVPPMAGLADGVVTRVRAEREYSWRGTFGRAVDDWHWAIVGAGSVTGTSVVTLIVSAMLFFGPGPGRSDSLAAVFRGPAEQPTSFVVLENGQDWHRMVLGAGGDRRTPGRGAHGVARAAFLGATERELVSLLSDRFSLHGAAFDATAMSDVDRRYTEALLDQISNIRSSTTEVLMVDSTTVNASGL